MSVELVIQFVSSVPENPVLQHRVAGVKDPQAIVQIAALAGYSFTVEDWQAGVEHINQRRQDDYEFVKNTGGPLTIPEEVVGLEDFFDPSFLE